MCYMFLSHKMYQSLSSLFLPSTIYLFSLLLFPQALKSWLLDADFTVFIILPQVWITKQMQLYYEREFSI